VSAGLEPPFGARDPGNMADWIAGAPRQIERALATGVEQPWRLPRAGADLLAVGALGGSAISADLTAALYRDRLPHPLLTVRGYRWPAFVTARSLALLSSYSGETEETLALYREAGERGVPRAAITSGGTLAAWCAEDAVPCVRLPGGTPPRAAAYGSWVMVTRLLHALGWTPDPDPEWRRTARQLEARAALWAPEVPEASNPAKRLARQLDQAFVYIYAGESLEPVATRWRNQLNENAKLLAHSAVVPELNHNEVVGWEGARAREGRSAVLIVRDADDSPEVSARLTLTAEYAESRGARVLEWREDQGERLTRFVSLVQFGDYVSLYLALLAGVDPTPVASIVEFKRRLAELGARRG
jgi:glucose/mannose-6-phosphate isomerase